MVLGPLRFTNALGGTADFIYPGPTIDMQSPASAGAVNGTTYLYYAQSFDTSQWEIGKGAYTSGSGTFARTSVQANSLGTTAKINFGSPPQVFVFDLQIDANTADIAKLKNNQFARVMLTTTNQTGLSDSTYTKINFNTVDFDPSSIWDNTNKQFKPTIAGYYKAAWGASLQVSAGSMTGIASLFKNGSLHTTGSFGGVASSPPVISVNSAIVHVNGLSDVIEVRAFISGTASRDIIAGTNFTWFDTCLVKAD